MVVKNGEFGEDLEGAKEYLDKDPEEEDED